MIVEMENCKFEVKKSNTPKSHRHNYTLLLYYPISFFFFKLGFTPCKAEQPLQGMELQEKKHKKDYRIQKICLERTYC